MAGINSGDVIQTFSKQISKATISEKVLDNLTDVHKVLDVISKLENQQSVGILNLSDIGLRTNPKKWIVTALNNFPRDNSRDIQNLLYDFTDSMQTRMREESKHALGLLMENKLLLCHSKYGEKTITPEWKIIPRMLDVDNILRFVSFSIAEHNPEKVIVRFWERSSTYSFIDWLGLPKKQAFLFGGKYRLLSVLDGVNIEFQFTEEEIDDWIDAHPEFKEGEIQFSKPISSSVIEEIRIGSKHYENPEDFIQDYEAEKFGVPFYINEYKKIKDNKLPLLMKYFDEETQVVRVEGDEISIIIQKNTDNFHIIFTDEDIELRNHYLKLLENDISNGNEVNIYHVGVKFKSDFIQIDNIRFYNEIRISKLTQSLIDYFNQVNHLDPNLRRIFLYILFRVLSRDNRDQAINYLFESISKELFKKLSVGFSFTNGEDDLIEYKSRDSISTNENTIRFFVDDISVKLKKNPCKFYFIGVEDNNTIDSIPASRLSSDRIETLRRGIANQLANVEINIHVIGDKELLLVLT
ncbi:MAG: hypothetical protein SVR94_17405, partial [Pseudomonadota bacterium]|nr:hypothetical protein [Pseudomonadota bacterium]